MERNGVDNEEYMERLRQSTARLRETDRCLIAAKKEIANMQELLAQSQVVEFRE